MSRFDHVAASWDDDPVRRERAQILAEELIPLIRANGLKTGLDFGGGTGLVSFFLLEELEQIDVVDLSEGMIDQTRKKIHAWEVHNIRAFAADLTAVEWPYRYDCIYTLLTLHHIHDVDGILQRLYDLLLPGGFLCIADLDKEDGSFHSEHPDFDGHNGFDQQELARKMEAAGFTNVGSHIFYTLKKELEDGTSRDYPLFLMFGERKD
jgi:ubiquinone/menaquinone biosynthesis C-methylase UbiE